MACGNCRNPNSVYIASSLKFKKVWARIEINSSEPFPKIIFFLLSVYLLDIALINSSLTWGGYLFSSLEKFLRALIAFKDAPRALSFADNLIKSPSSSIILVVILWSKNSKIFSEIFYVYFSDLSLRIPSLNS